MQMDLAINNKTYYLGFILFYLGLVLYSFANLIYSYIGFSYLEFIIGFSYKPLVLPIFFAFMGIGAFLGQFLQNNLRLSVKLYVYNNLAIFILILIYSYFVFSYDSFQLPLFLGGIISLILYVFIALGSGISLPLLQNGLKGFEIEANNKTKIVLKSYVWYIFGIILAIFSLAYLLANHYFYIVTFTNILVVIGLIVNITAFQLIASNIIEINPEATNTTRRSWFNFDFNILSITNFALGLVIAIFTLSWWRLFAIAFGPTIQISILIFAAILIGLLLGALYAYKDYLNFEIKKLGFLLLLMSLFSVLSFIFYNENYLILNGILKVLSKNNYALIVWYIAVFILLLINILPTMFCAAIATFKSFALKPVNSFAIFLFGITFGIVIWYLLISLLSLKGIYLLGVILTLLISWALYATLDKFFNKASLAIFLIILMLLLYTIPWFQLDYKSMRLGLWENYEKDLKDYSNYYNYDGKNQSVNVQLIKLIASRTDPNLGSLKRLMKYTQVINDGSLTGKSITVPFTNELSITEKDAATLTSLVFALDPNPKKVLSFGISLGLYQNLLLNSKSIEKLITVDPEFGNQQAAQLIGEKSKLLFTDSRSEIITNDTINYLRSSNNKFDLIITDIPNLYFEDNTFEITQEFYKLALNHLNPDGMLIQELDLKFTDRETIAHIVNALGNVFKDYELYQGNNNKIIIVASPEIVPSLQDEKFTHSRLKSIYARSSIKSIDDLKLRFIGGKKTLQKYFAKISNNDNSYFLPIIAKNQQAALFSGKKENDLLAINANNIITQIERNDIPKLNPEINPEILASRYYREANNLYNAIMTSHEFINSNIYMLDPKNNYCINSPQKWSNALINIQNLILNFLPREEAKQLLQKIVPEHCFKNLNILGQLYVSYFYAVIKQDYQNVLTLSQKILQYSVSQSERNLLIRNAFIALLKLDQKDNLRGSFEQNYPNMDTKNNKILNNELYLLYFNSFDDNKD